MVIVDGRKYGLRAAELPGVPSDADLADNIILTARLDGEPLLTASRTGHAQNGRVMVPLKVRVTSSWRQSIRTAEPTTCGNENARPRCMRASHSCKQYVPVACS